MKLPQFLIFLVLAFAAVVAYFILGAVLSAPLAMFSQIRFLTFFFNRLVPIAIGLVIAGKFGAWSRSTHVAYQALAVFASGLMLLPARIALGYLGLMLCGSIGGCFN